MRVQVITDGVGARFRVWGKRYVMVRIGVKDRYKRAV